MLLNIASQFAEKADRVEEFKSNNAVLKNSVQYLSSNSAEVSLSLADYLNAELRTQFLTLLSSLLRFSIAPDNLEEERLAKLVSQLETSLAFKPKAETENLRLFLSHARALLHSRRRNDQLVFEIRSISLEQPALNLLEHWSKYTDLINSRIQRYQWLLFAAALALLLHAAVAMARLQIAARSLAEANEHLEDRVRKRTEELHQANEELITARELAIEATRLKSQFLANMSHEIRTPMNGIIGMTELSLADDISEDVRENLTSVLECSNSLLSIINDILDFSKVEAGKLTLDPHPFELGEMLRSLERLIRNQAGGRCIELVLALQPNLPYAVISDALRLRQVLVNLISNAIKFTPNEGAVVLHVSTKFESGTAAQLVFGIADSGIGIASSKLGQIFKAFEQADGSTTRKYGGTGLGLTIVKQLVELMHGTIEVLSTVNVGSCFVVNIPVETLTEQAFKSFNSNRLQVSPSTPPSTKTQSLRILVAEDNLVNQKLILKILEKAGHLPAMASDGEQVLALLAQSTFDLILMDIQMPKMSGIEATMAIRISGASYAQIPIIALTANAMKGDEEEYRKAGMTGYVSKPINTTSLFAEIEAINKKLKI